jgi:hypothetical protein
MNVKYVTLFLFNILTLPRNIVSNSPTTKYI